MLRKNIGVEQMVDLLYKGIESLKKKEGVWSQRWIWLYKGKERIDSGEVQRKKKGFGLNGGFDFI